MSEYWKQDDKNVIIVNIARESHVAGQDASINSVFMTF